VFEAKVREPNPRLPFQLTVGALSVAAVGTIIYFWIQLSPPAPLVNTNPPPPAPSGAQAAPAPVTPAPAAPAQAAIPGLPSATPATRPPDAPVKPAPRATVPVAQPRSATPAIPRDTPAPRVARVTRSAPVERAPEGPLLATSRPAPQVHPRVVSAYAAY
jgi:hypothetical protein